jgi:hypothetical protein
VAAQASCAGRLQVIDSGTPSFFDRSRPATSMALFAWSRPGPGNVDLYRTGGGSPGLLQPEGRRPAHSRKRADVDKQTAIMKQLT